MFNVFRVRAAEHDWHPSHSPSTPSSPCGGRGRLKGVGKQSYRSLLSLAITAARKGENVEKPYSQYGNDSHYREVVRYPLTGFQPGFTLNDYDLGFSLLTLQRRILP
jgi:hypothetical protein